MGGRLFSSISIHQVILHWNLRAPPPPRNASGKKKGLLPELLWDYETL